MQSKLLSNYTDVLQGLCPWALQKSVRRSIYVHCKHSFRTEYNSGSPDWKAYCSLLNTNYTATQKHRDPLLMIKDTVVWHFCFLCKYKPQRQRIRCTGLCSSQCNRVILQKEIKIGFKSNYGRMAMSCYAKMILNRRLILFFFFFILWQVLVIWLLI